MLTQTRREEIRDGFARYMRGENKLWEDWTDIATVKELKEIIDDYLRVIDILMKINKQERKLDGWKD